MSILHILIHIMIYHNYLLYKT
ncbi:hypothetical protein, partial [Plasmodium yoelii yoelii]